MATPRFQHRVSSAKSLVLISGRSTIGHELERAGSSKIGSFAQGFASTDAHIPHVGSGHAADYGPIKAHTVKGFDNPRLAGRQ
eukprot:3350278-Amphidinium_carterae.1